MGQHRIAADECLVSLALERGLDPKTLWEEEGNQEIRAQRQLMNCLAEGDSIHLPDDIGGHELQLNQEQSLIVQETHYRLPIRVLSTQWEGVANITVKCWIESLEKAIEAVTNDEGIVWFDLPLNVTDGYLAFEYEDRVNIQPFQVGELNPPELDRGQQQRLANLTSQFTPELPANQLVAALADDSGQTEEDLKAILVGTV